MSDAAQLPVERRASAAVAVSAPMPTALALYLDDALYDRVSSVASRMSKATGVTPKHLIGAPEACFAVVSRAITWRLDPFAVAMATYQTPGGQIGFEGKLVHAIIENSGCLDPTSGGIRYVHYGDWSHIQGRFAIKESQGDGKAKKYAVPTWTDDDARKGKPDSDEYPLAQSCGVRVIAQLRGESKPRTLDFDLIQAQPRNSTLWATDPMTQICYTAVRRFGSVAAPTLLMGVPFEPEDRFPDPNAREVDVTPPRPDIPMPRSRQEPEMAVSTVEPEQEGDEPPLTASAPQQPAAAPAQPAPAPAKVSAAPAPPAPAPSQPGDGGSEPSGGDLLDAPPSRVRVASEAQRAMLLGMGKRAGLSPEALDEKLIDKLTMPLASLPMSLVNQTAQMIKSLTPPNA